MKAIQLLFFLLSSLIFSQNSKTDYKITYNLTYKLDSTKKGKTYNENFLLLFSNGKSKFMSKSYYLADSLIYFSKKNNTNPSLAANMAVSIPHTKFRFTIYKDYSSNKIKVYDQIFTDMFKYEENKNAIAWKIKKDVKKVNGYNCQKAQTSFGGRNYIAWFPKDIKINDGPYKFSGLPGLIIKIYDDKNHYNFTLVGIEKSKVDISENRTQDIIINTTKPDFYRALKDFNENMNVRIQNNPNFDFGKSKRKVKKNKNPIELKIK